MNWATILGDHQTVAFEPMGNDRWIAEVHTDGSDNIDIYALEQSPLTDAGLQAAADLLRPTDPSH